MPDRAAQDGVSRNPTAGPVIQGEHGLAVDELQAQCGHDLPPLVEGSETGMRYGPPILAQSIGQQQIAAGRQQGHERLKRQQHPFVIQNMVQHINGGDDVRLHGRQIGRIVDEIGADIAAIRMLVHKPVDHLGNDVDAVGLAAAQTLPEPLKIPVPQPKSRIRFPAMETLFRVNRR